MIAMLWAQQIMLGKKTYAEVPRLLNAEVPRLLNAEVPRLLNAEVPRLLKAKVKEILEDSGMGELAKEE